MDSPTIRPGSTTPSVTNASPAAAVFRENCETNYADEYRGSLYNPGAAHLPSRSSILQMRAATGVAPTGTAPAGSSSTLNSAGLDPARRPSDPRPGSIDTTNPQVGTAQDPPSLSAGTTKSPVFLGTEAQYFQEARNVIANAQPGDMICAQMYEFQNADTNPESHGATASPGYADQQAILPELAAAANRGVKVNLVLDASKNEKTHEIANQPIVDYLNQNAGASGNMTIDYYPPETVNIDHAKELVHMTPDGQGGYQVQEALAGGTNWGNHTAANDDGGGIFYGRDAVGAGQIFFRDQAFCRGDRTSAPNPVADETGPVEWRTTSPSQEGGGAAGIRDAQLQIANQSDNVYVDTFCLNHPGLLQALEAKGSNAFVRVDPGERKVNSPGLDDIRSSGGTAMWANVDAHPNTMAGQLNHEKLLLGETGGVATAAAIGSANQTNSGFESTREVVDPSTGRKRTEKTNHEIDAIVTRESGPDGYSTAPFLDAMDAKIHNDFANNSLQDPPSHTGGTQPGQF